MTTEQIAAICHTVNRAYCLSIGDDSQAHWDNASPEQRESATIGAGIALADPTFTPEVLHASWCRHKRNQGWRYGSVKDEALKTHRCLVEWDDLPREQKAKDYLFHAVTNSLRPYWEPPDAAA